MHNAVNGSVKRANKDGRRQGKSRRVDEERGGETGKSVVEGSRVETSKTGASNEPANQPASYPDGRLLTVTP